MKSPCRWSSRVTWKAGQGVLHVPLVAQLKVPGQAAVGPVLLPHIALMLGPPPPHVQGGPHVVPGLPAGAQDVVHYSPAEAVRPPLEPPELATAPVTEAGGGLQGAALAVGRVPVEQALPGGRAGEAAALHPLPSLPEGLDRGDNLPEVAAAGEGRDDGAAGEHRHVVGVAVVTGIDVAPSPFTQLFQSVMAPPPGRTFE